MIYLHHFGIDVSSEWFDVCLFSQKNKVKRYASDSDGIAAFFSDYKADLPTSLTVLEATGGYELKLLFAYHAAGFALHRTSGYHARHFANSLKLKAKSDKQDALSLARLCFERANILQLYHLPSEAQRRFTSLAMRIEDLLSMRVAEQNRVQNPNYSQFTAKIEAHIASLTAGMEEYRQEMRDIVKANDEMSLKVSTMQSMKGFGEIIAFGIVAKLPEIGLLTHKQIASLAGVAPHERSSGKFTGHARVFGGRCEVKRMLFLAALSASRYDEKMKIFYQGLIARGKSKMLALSAVARKLIVIANAKIRDALAARNLEPALKEILP